MDGLTSFIEMIIQRQKKSIPIPWKNLETAYVKFVQNSSGGGGGGGGGEAFFKLYFVGGAFEVRLRDERLDFTEKNAGFWQEVENFVPGLSSCVLNYLN